MPSMECSHCHGTGYTEDASGEDVICARCDGTGVLLTDEVAGAAESEHWAGFSSRASPMSLVVRGARRRLRLADQILQHREPVGHLRFRSRAIRPRRANARGALLRDRAGGDEQVEEDI